MNFLDYVKAKITREFRRLRKKQFIHPIFSKDDSSEEVLKPKKKVQKIQKLRHENEILFPSPDPVEQGIKSILNADVLSPTLPWMNKMIANSHVNDSNKTSDREAKNEKLFDEEKNNKVVKEIEKEKIIYHEEKDIELNEPIETRRHKVNKYSEPQNNVGSKTLNVDNSNMNNKDECRLKSKIEEQSEKKFTGNYTDSQFVKTRTRFFCPIGSIFPKHM